MSFRRPNIVYIHSHDTGRYVQPHGHAIATPHIQKLAEQGVLFRQAHTVSPTCSPSRSALLTGQYPHRSGMLGLAHRGFRLNDPTRHLAHTLKNTGYQTAIVGQQHIAKYVDGWEQQQELGYERILDRENIELEPVRRAAVDFIGEEHTKPFFLSVGFAETHRPFPSPDPRDDPGYTLPPAPLPDTPEVRQDMAAYKTAARLLDAAMGSVFDAIDAAGLSKNTLILCTTDHGIAFPKMKCNLTDHGTGVMMIMRGPGGFTGGKVIDALISQIDVFPTLCELLKIDPPAWLDGQSFLPIIHGTKTSIRSELFGQVNYHAAYEPMRSVRTERWKYIRRFDPRSGPVLPNCDESPSMDALLRLGWKDEKQPDEMLFDLLFDPNEAKNIAGQVEFAAVLNDMRARLDQWMKQTEDPLLHGPIPLPEGAVVNMRDQSSASEKVSREI